MADTANRQATRQIHGSMLRIVPPMSHFSAELLQECYSRRIAPQSGATNLPHYPSSSPGDNYCAPLAIRSPQQPHSTVPRNGKVMRRVQVSSLLIGGALLLAASLTYAQSTCTNTTFTVAGSAGTSPNGVNRYDTVVGEYLDSATSRVRGFRWNNGSIMKYLYPNAASTIFYGNNDLGAIAGSYSASRTHGFILYKGTTYAVDFPNAAETEAMGINNSGVIVGTYFTNTNFTNASGFFRNSSGYHKLVVPGASATFARAISNSGVIAGFFIDGSGNTHGFTYANGTFKTIDFPGATSTEVHGINKYGTLVGLYRTSSTGAPTGFTRYNTGTFAPYKYPGATSTTLDGINDLGDRAGGAGLSGSEPGFLRICR